MLRCYYIICEGCLSTEVSQQCMSQLFRQWPLVVGMYVIYLEYQNVMGVLPASWYLNSKQKSCHNKTLKYLFNIKALLTCHCLNQVVDICARCYNLVGLQFCMIIGQRLHSFPLVHTGLGEAPPYYSRCFIDQLANHWGETQRAPPYEVNSDICLLA